MSDFDKLIEEEKSQELHQLYANLVKALDDKSGFEAIANQIKAFQENIESLSKNLADQGSSEELQNLYKLQSKLQEANSKASGEWFRSLGEILEKLISSTEQAQQVNAGQIQRMSEMTELMTKQLTRQYDLMMKKIEQDQNAEWEFTTEEVKNEIITKVRIKRIS